MKAYLVLLLNLLLLSPLFAQEELRLLSSRYSTIIEQKGFSSIQPVYLHKGNTLSADSGIIYEDTIGRQFFEAFGNIVITQPSGTVIYADRLFYDAAPQIATLTNNVRMVDQKSVLTTNHLVYKMRDKIGNYTGGGRIISQTDTITSLNAYYFENTDDAYFRNKVVVRTPDVKIYTDTMRYNSMQRLTYFFGPTNIKGNKDENLYTEKGNYNTELGIANFSKNNLYTEGTRFLKGDSLYYDRTTAVGKAYRNVVFVDTLDKFYAYGGYGLYNQQEESITMTDKPLITMLVKNDSTQSPPADTVSSPTLVPLEKEKKQAKDDFVEEHQADSALRQKVLVKQDSSAASLQPPADVDSVYMTADTIFSKMILLKDYIPKNFELNRDGGELETDDDVDYGDDEEGDEFAEPDELEAPKRAGGALRKLSPAEGDAKTSLEATEPTEEAEKAAPKEALKKPAKELKKPTATAALAEANPIEQSLKQDSILRRKAVIPTDNQADSLINQALLVAQTPDIDTSLALKDSNNTAYLDTARTRIVKAYYNVRMYKSDLQAVADSLYYGMADSMFRFMGRPMIWAENSQISSDTIFMQIQQQKLDNALLLGNAFMVNVVLDSLQFNQLKGRKITAFFANNNIEKIFVDGNAENLVFSADERTKIITEMFHDRGARIKIRMENKKIIDYITMRKVDQKVYPFKLVTPENEVLPGFVWLPQDRPKSKEDMINRKRELPKDSPLPAAAEEEGGKQIEKPKVETFEEEAAETEETQEPTTESSTEAVEQEVAPKQEQQQEEAETDASF